MKIAMINASPKKNGTSASGALLKDLYCFLAEHEIKDFNINSSEVKDNTILELNNFDSLVFAFPLYVDGVPSHLLSWLCRMDEIGFSNKSIKVYCIVNCGFYEGIQNKNAVDIIKNWCARTKLLFGMGVGFGGGGAITFVSGVPLGKGPKKSLGVAYKKLSESIISGTPSDDTYINVGLPKFMYKISAEMVWKKSIKSNGGIKKDLNRRL